MIKKQIALILIFMSLSVYQSCDKCEGGESYKFEVAEMGARVQVFNRPDFDSTKFYQYDSLILILFVEQIQQIAALSNTPSFLISSAMACSPLEPYSDDKIRAFTLVANKNASDSQNVQIEIGDTLNRFFVVDYNPIQFQPMDTTFPLRVSSLGQFWYYKWNVQPAQPINIVFDAHISLANGRSWVVSNLNMKLR
jgi:hypothetical protein